MDQDDLLHAIDHLVIDLVDNVSELEKIDKPENYSQLVTDIRNYVISELKGEEI